MEKKQAIVIPVICSRNAELDVVRSNLRKIDRNKSAWVRIERKHGHRPCFQIADDRKIGKLEYSPAFEKLREKFNLVWYGRETEEFTIDIRKQEKRRNGKIVRFVSPNRSVIKHFDYFRLPLPTELALREFRLLLSECPEFGGSEVYYSANKLGIFVPTGGTGKDNDKQLVSRKRLSVFREKQKKAFAGEKLLALARNLLGEQLAICFIVDVLKGESLIMQEIMLNDDSIKLLPPDMFFGLSLGIWNEICRDIPGFPALYNRVVNDRIAIEDMDKSTWTEQEFLDKTMPYDLLERFCQCYRGSKQDAAALKNELGENIMPPPNDNGEYPQTLKGLFA